MVVMVLHRMTAAVRELLHLSLIFVQVKAVFVFCLSLFLRHSCAGNVLTIVVRFLQKQQAARRAPINLKRSSNFYQS